jgi:hypothetical protein
MPYSAAETDRIQRLRQAAAQPETSAIHESDDTFQSLKFNTTHLTRESILEYGNIISKSAWSEHARQSQSSTVSYENFRDFIRHFADTVQEQIGRHSSITEAAIPRSSTIVQSWLENALQVYATQLLVESAVAVNNSTGAEKNEATLTLFGAVLIQHCKAPIAHYLQMSRSSPLSVDYVIFILRQMDPPDLSPERLGLEAKPMIVLENGTRGHPPIERKAALSGDDIIELSDYLERPMTDVEFGHIMDLLASTEEMRLLTRCLQYCKYRHDSFAMQMIEAAMSKENLIDLHRDGYEAIIMVPWWSIESFMFDQYGEMSRFGSVVTLTGHSTQHAQASTCADYVKTTWPDTGGFFLELLDAIHATIVASDTLRTSQISLKSDRSLFVQMATGYSLPFIVSFMARATDETLLVQLAQQLSWLSSAFTVSPFKERLAHSNSFFFRRMRGCFEISIDFEAVDEPKKTCWPPLFDGACIVAGFPISERAEEIGLEVSLELLAGLSGARHVVEYEGGLVMKGFSHMFVPVRRQLDRVQWHAISSSDEETPLSYHDGLSRCASRATLDEVSLKDLASLRTIVGWCSVATTCLGSSHADYENIDYTKADEANSGLRCTGGSLGFQQFGVAALDVKFGLKDGKSHFQRSGPYQRIIRFAEGSPIVLHEVERKQSWLVPATNVMLHIVQHRHRLDPFQENGKPMSLDTDIITGSSAKQVLLENRNRVLFEDETHTFMDEILDIWSVLEFLLAQNLTRQREAPGVRIPSSLHESIYGFEFKAVVQQDAPYKLKKTTISRNHGGWSKLIEDVDALVLFANGFGDVILPAGVSKEDLCHKWRRVPHGQDYLTTTTNMLQTFFDKAGSRVDRKYLTIKSKLRWHQGSSALFNECQDVTTCDCTRLQQLVPESAIKSAQPPTSIADEGAVIFGHPEPRSAPLRSTVSKISSSLYSQPNIPILPRIVRRRSSTNDERKGKIRRLDIEAEELSCEQNHRPQATS